MKIKEITDYLESLAPKSSQESYDNSGLLVGNPLTEVTSALVCLDSIEEVVDEAISKGCNLIIAHHPIIFSGLKSLTGKTYIERTIIKCIQHNIALYAIHTNLDNYQFGVNFEIGTRLGLENLRILAPKSGVLKKLTVFVPEENATALANALFEAGAGAIGNYSECSFSSVGVGTFKPNESAMPFSGEIGKRANKIEEKLEVIVSQHELSNVLSAMKKNHPYEEIAYDLISLDNKNSYEGSGMIGDLPKEMKTIDFLKSLKKSFNCGAIRYTKNGENKIRKVAFCGGSGRFLLETAKQNNADIFISSDFKYHEFFDAENDLIIADIGHYESEQFTINLLERILKKKFPNFAVHLTGINTNPINYL